MKDKERIKKILIGYVFQDMKNASFNEFKITMYFLAILLFTAKKSFYTSIDMLEKGGFPLIGERNNTRFIGGVGLTRQKIIDAIGEVNRRGILKVYYQSNHEDVIEVAINNYERSM